jgi:hypothetical protein
MSNTTIHAERVIVDDDDYEVNNRKRKKASSEQLRLDAFSKKGFVKNVQGNADRKLLKALGYGMLGATLYPLVPTVVQTISGSDMSGFKGLVLGVGTAALLGLGIGKPAVTVGAVSAMATHLLYSKGTKAIEDTFNTQIFRMNPAVVYVDTTDINTATNNNNNLVNN